MNNIKLLVYLINTFTKSNTYIHYKDILAINQNKQIKINYKVINLIYEFHCLFSKNIIIIIIKLPINKPTDQYFPHGISIYFCVKNMAMHTNDVCLNTINWCDVDPIRTEMRLNIVMIILKKKLEKKNLNRSVVIVDVFAWSL